MRRIDHIPARLAREAVERVVVRDGARSWTGTALEDAVVTAAQRLAAHGVRPGDRVVIVNENSAALVVTIFALSRIGAWPVIVNARLTAAELDAIRAHCEPRLTLYTVEASPAAAVHATRDGANIFDLGDIGAVAAGPTHESAPAHDGDVAVLIYTSGTTGQPKGVMLTHGNLLFVAEMSGRVRRLSPADRVYAVLPIAHVFGLASVFLGTLFHGGELRLVPRFDAKEAARALDEDGITVFQGVPAMYARLLELAAQRGRPLPAPQLRYISAGGAPLDPAIKARIETMWGAALHNGYGLTETAPTVTTTETDRPATDNSVGPALPGVELRIVDPATGRDAPTDAVGELWVRGPNVMKGYYRDPAATASVLLPDGWLRTGDLARIDARGHLYIAGRLKELIIRSGFNVYPPEVEAVLTTHPDVAIAAVLGRAVDGNEEVVAFVQPVAGRALDIEALKRFAADRLAPYKRPSHYVVMDALPATPAGKVLKARLAGELAALPRDHASA